MVYSLKCPPSFRFDKEPCLPILWVLDEVQSWFIKSEEDCGEVQAALLCFSTQPVTVTSTPPQCLLFKAWKKSLLSADGCTTTFEISVISRLLSSRGQRNGRRKTDELGNEAEEQKSKIKPCC